MRYYAPTAFRSGGVDYPQGWLDLPPSKGDPLVATGQLYLEVPDGGSQAVPSGAAVLYGLYANRPAAGPAYQNKLYICTDRRGGAPAFCDAASWVSFAVPDRPKSEVTASRTLTAADDGVLLLGNSASTITLTLPAGLPVGFQCRVQQVGAGKCTIAASGATVNAQSSKFSTAAQHATIEVLPALAVDAYTVTGQSGL